MNKIKYDIGKIIVPSLGFVFFGLLGFPLFLNFRVERIIVYIVFFAVGFVFNPLTDINNKRRRSDLRFVLIMLYFVAIIVLFWFTPHKVFAGILAFSSPAGSFLYWIIEEIYKLKKVNKRKRKDTTEDNEEMR